MPVLRIASLLCLVGIQSVAYQSPRDLKFGKAVLTLSAGAAVANRPGAHGAFGGTLIDLGPRMTVEVARLGTATGSLRQFVDSAVKARNAQLDAKWPRLIAMDTVVGKRRVMVLHPACGDCEATEVYLDVAGERLVASWGVDGLGARTIDERNAAGWRLVAGVH